jgi:hypothetical protein
LGDGVETMIGLEVGAEEKDVAASCFDKGIESDGELTAKVETDDRSGDAVVIAGGDALEQEVNKVMVKMEIENAILRNDRFFTVISSCCFPLPQHNYLG